MTNSINYSNIEKVEIDGETVYVDHTTGKTLKKLSKEEFREGIEAHKTAEEKRIDAVNAKAMKEWNDERERQHQKDNSHVRGTTKGGGGKGNVVRDELMEKFNNNLKAENIATIFTSKTTIGLKFGEDHYEIKAVKKNTPLEDFTDKPAKPDVAKHEIFHIILEGIEEESIIVKNDIFIRMAENDYQVKITKKRTAIEGL